MKINSNYKKLFAKLFIFVIIFLVADRITGAVLKAIYFGEKTGKYYRMNYSIYETDAQMVIFGSSRANRNYIPSILAKKTGFSCYNAGVQGEGILYSTAIEEMMLKRYSPNVIILNIDPEMLRKFDPFYDRLADLLPYYDDHKEIMRKFINLKGNWESFKLLLETYRYNSKILHLMRYLFIHQKDYNGFRPLYGHINYSANIDYSNIQSFFNNKSKFLDANFVDIFEEFVRNAILKKSKLIFCISPNYFPIGGRLNYLKYSASFRCMDSIAAKYKIPIVDLSNDPKFIFKNNLFYDLSHLNNKGAEFFSKELADSINSIFYRSELAKQEN